MITRAHEKHIRSIAKALTYRLFSILFIIFVGVYMFHFDYSAILGFALLDFVFKIIAFYINERMWTHIDWGYGATDKDFFYKYWQQIEKWSGGERQRDKK